MSAIATEAGLTGTVSKSRAGLIRQAIAERKAAALGLGIIVFFVILAIAAPLIAPYSTTAPSCAVFAPPSANHWLGCDDGGIDMLSEIISGGRISLIIGFAATLIAMVIGGGVGIASGYFGRWLDITLMRVTDYLLVIPDLAFAMVIADVWGPSLSHVIAVIAILEWATTARIIRAQVMSVKERVYIKRARSIGASHARIIGRHILPQVGPLLMANTPSRWRSTWRPRLPSWAWRTRPPRPGGPSWRTPSTGPPSAPAPGGRSSPMGWLSPC